MKNKGQVHSSPDGKKRMPSPIIIMNIKGRNYHFLLYIWCFITVSYYPPELVLWLKKQLSSRAFQWAIESPGRTPLYGVTWSET